MHENEPNKGMKPRVSADDSLFEALGQSKKRKRRRVVRTVLIIVLVLAIALTTAVLVLRKRVQERFAAMDVEVQSYQVTTGSISTVVSGSGTLQHVDTEEAPIPDGVEVTDILVSYGDVVEQGDVIAAVDMGTVRSAMAQLQTTIDDLDEQISDAEGDAVDTYVKAGVSGRVKKIYAESEMDVADVMVANGALALISLDGYMAVDIQTDALTMGQEVAVVLADGQQVSGSVEYAAAGKATILVTDNGPAYEETVQVCTEDGVELGSGQLYIHQMMGVTGYAGTISRVNASENQKVYASSTILTLTDTGSTANYDALLRQRQEAEESLLELLKIQRGGGILAPISGSVLSVSNLEDEELTQVATVSADKEMSVTITVDENDILSLEVGQTAMVSVSSVSEEELSGVVTEIDKSGASDYYTAQITLEKLEGMLQGMTASVDVRIEGVDDAIIIPVDALNQTSNGAYVYTAYEQQTQQYGGKVDVATGISNDEYVQIKSGLSVGDTVYYTKTQSFMDMFGGMFGGGGAGSSGGSGSRPDFGGSGGQMPDFDGGQMPDRGSMPNMGGMPQR